MTVLKSRKSTNKPRLTTFNNKTNIIIITTIMESTAMELQTFKSNPHAQLAPKLSLDSSEKSTVLPITESRFHSIDIESPPVEMDLSATAYTSELERRKRLTRAVARRNHFFNPYRRFFTLVLLANLAGIILYLWKHWFDRPFPLSLAINISATNVLTAILVRQEYVINALYMLCWYTPHSWPLRLRCIITKVYEHGGIHSGAAVSGTSWFVLFTVLMTLNFARGYEHSIATITVCSGVVVLLSTIITFALPLLRNRFHNAFERTHRFCGWGAVSLFWVIIVLALRDQAKATGMRFRQALFATPAFWLLIVITIHVFLPWLRLRKMKFIPIVLSRHAIRLNFQEKYPQFTGIALSLSPIVEWHPFAVFPNPNGNINSHSVIISHTGDWTRQQIDNPRTEYWVKGIPKVGLLSMSFLFNSVVVVTTGSGIGPCLTLLLDNSKYGRRTKCHVIWSTKRPVGTYGNDIIDGIRQCDPDANIIDTDIIGRPDLINLAYVRWKRTEAEAVFVISNAGLTRKIVEALEEVGVPAFGPIWDS
jgi:hypothetical protein